MSLPAFARIKRDRVNTAFCLARYLAIHRFGVCVNKGQSLPLHVVELELCALAQLLFPLLNVDAQSLKVLDDATCLWRRASR